MMKLLQTGVGVMFVLGVRLKEKEMIYQLRCTECNQQVEAGADPIIDLERFLNAHVGHTLVFEESKATEQGERIPEGLRDKLAAELERVAADDKVREKAERLHRKVSRLSAEDLFRPFNI